MYYKNFAFDMCIGSLYQSNINTMYNQNIILWKFVVKEECHAYAER